MWPQASLTGEFRYDHIHSFFCDVGAALQNYARYSWCIYGSDGFYIFLGYVLLISNRQFIRDATVVKQT